MIGNPAGRNLRDVWSFPTQPFGLEMCAVCKRIYDARHFRRLGDSQDWACAECGGKVAVKENEWAAWECANCGAEYDLRYIEGLPKRKVCRCGASDWLSHFATYPEALVERCILSSTPTAVCSKCGAPHARVIEPSPNYAALFGSNEGADADRYGMGYRKHSPTATADYKTLGYRPTCSCSAPSQSALVLDPFCGSGTTNVVAKRLGRRSIGIDLSSDYLLLGAYRLERTQAVLAAMEPNSED